MKSCIYQILNLVNGKFYIGHTVNYDVRWWEHERKLRANQQPKSEEHKRKIAETLRRKNWDAMGWT